MIPPADTRPGLAETLERIIAGSEANLTVSGRTFHAALVAVVRAAQKSLPPKYVVLSSRQQRLVNALAELDKLVDIGR